MLFTAAFAQVAVELCDAISNGIWSATCANAVDAVDGLLRGSMTLAGSATDRPLTWWDDVAVESTVVADVVQGRRRFAAGRGLVV